MDHITSEYLTEDKYARRTERTIRNQGGGSTDGALAVVNHYFTTMDEIVKRKLSEHKHQIPLGLFTIDSELLSLAGIQGALSSICEGHKLSRTLYIIGSMVEDQVYDKELKEWDTVGHARMVADVTRRYPGIKNRKRRLRSIAHSGGFKWTRWTQSEHARAGKWLVEALVETPAFVLVEEFSHNDRSQKKIDSHIALTEDALEVLEEFVSATIAKSRIWLPMVSQPEPWVSYEQSVDENGPAQLVRTHYAQVSKVITKAIKEERMPGVLKAVNAAQGVPFTINKFIMDVVQKCYDEGIKVEGLPPKEDLPIPERPSIELACFDPNVDHMKAWKRRASDTYQVNASYVGLRMEYQLDMAIAKKFSEGPFWLPMNLDHRGRMYPLPRFHFQRQDYVRAMFQFEKGQVLNGAGVYWLKVHLANCGDFDKVSKKSFDERERWVDRNFCDLMDYAKDPIQYLGWTEADKPFMFLAACKAFSDSHYGFPCHLPIAFDGSCSGLQHLCAMTRDPSGSLVNLTPHEAPQDIYETVAKATRERIEEDRANPLAQVILKGCIDRSKVKRATMTLAYGSEAFGMGNQILEDLMRPLSLKVLEGTLAEHPYGDDGGYRAAIYLAGHVYKAISETVERPVAAMKYLQSIAGAMAHESKPVIWHTPLGFPVVIYKPDIDFSQLRLTLHDRGIKKIVSYTYVRGTLPTINKNKAENAVAPGFVHSLDATHLMMVTNACADEGIELALVHDSFSCLPNHAPRLRKILVDQFYKMYSENDVLADVRKEAIEQLETNKHKVPPVPTYGTLNLSLVKQSKYAFA